MKHITTLDVDTAFSCSGDIKLIKLPNLVDLHLNTI